VPVRIFVPETVDAVYLHIHGGGFALGIAAMNDVSNSEIAKRCNFAVVSVDYRLAPEHPYPAGPDDCEAVAKWLIDSSESEFGTRLLVVGGESAGGNLSATTLLRVRDKIGAIDRFVAANLVYGAYDLTGTPSASLASDKSLVLKRSDMEAFGRLYLGNDDYEKRLDPDVSPLYADMSGLPPALFTVGGADPLLDDSLFMASRWQLAGNDAELAFYPECPHGFDMFPTKAALKARSRQMQWMVARVDKAGS
jgi:acetyl esterase/lipase